MAEDPLELVGVTLEERFHVDAYVDEGELSVTYRGHDLSNDAPVAIRCLNLPMTLDSALSSPFVDSFQERTRLYRRLAPGNSNFVQFLGAGTTTAPDTDRKIPFEIREWLDGVTFGTYCAKRRSLGHEGWQLDEVLTVLAPVAEGLAYAHDMGVTHGEINPNNIFVVETVGRPVLKIVDFGEARATGDKSGEGPPVLRVLVPEYAAPELIDKQLGAIGTWTDVFSLAVVVLECLAGSLDTRNVAASVIVDPMHRASSKRLGLTLPKAVEDVLERALALEPALRPKDVATLWRELEAASAAPAVPVVTSKAPPPAKPALPTKRPPVPPTAPRVPMAPAEGARPVALPPPPPLTPARMFPLEPSPTPAPSVPSAASNPLVKATLFGLQPLHPGAVAKDDAPSLPPEAEFSADESPTRRRDGAREEADDALADLPGAVEEQAPEVFLPALLQPTIGMRLRLAFDWVGDRGWPWLAARAKDRAPRARVAFGGSVFGGLLLLTLCFRLCAGRGSPKPAVMAASTPDTAAAEAHPVEAPAAPAATPPASGAIELPEEAPAAAAPSAPAPTTAFTRAGATAALQAAGGDLSDCKGLGDIRGPGSVRVSFNKSGGVSHIKIGPPYADTPEGACILDRFGRAQMGPVRGAPGSINYVFNVAK